MDGEKLDPKRFRLIVEQRGFAYRDLARGLRKRGVPVNTEAVTRLGQEPPSRVPEYAEALAELLRTKVGFLTGRHGQFLAKRFRDLYRTRGFTFTQLEEGLARWDVRVTPQYLQRLAAGRSTNPRQELVDGLAWLLNTTPDYLVGVHDDADAGAHDGSVPRWVRVAARGGLDTVPADVRRMLAVIAQEEARGDEPGPKQ